MQADGLRSWKVPERRVLHWSRDGNYAYLIDATLDPRPNSPELMFMDAGLLERLDLTNGDIIEILHHHSGNSYALAFSPDGRYLAYSSHPEDLSVKMLDLDTGRDTRFSIADSYSRAGLFLWSPDGTKVVFTAAGKGNWYSFQSSFSIYVIEAETRELRLLLNEPPHNYYADGWLSDSKIHVTGFDELAEFELDLVTGSFIQVSPIERLLSTKTPDATPEPTETLSAATIHAVGTMDSIRSELVNRYPGLQDYRSTCSSFSCYGIATSPDEKFVYFTNNNSIDIFHRDGHRIGSYTFYELYGYLIDYAGGYVFPTHWSNDGNYLYLSVTPGGDGGPESYLGYRSALIRLNLQNGTWRDLGVSGSFEIARNDRFIISSGHEAEVRVRDFLSGGEWTYSTADEYHFFGKYVWSPDSSHVIFSATSESWETDDSRFALFLLDLERQELNQIHESPLPFFYPVAWVEPNRVVLNRFQEWGEWILDLAVTPPVISPQ